MRSALFVSALLCVSALPAQDREFGVAVRTNLAAMRANPTAYQNVKVKFTVQFASLGRISNPFFTKFTPTDYADFYAWGDEQQIWQEPDYNDVFGTLFLSKGNSQLEALYGLRLYQRIQCTGVVRNSFQGMPWIEVLSFEDVGGQVDTAVLTHMHRGENLMEQRLWQRAIAELSRAPGEGVPQIVTMAAHRNLGLCNKGEECSRKHRCNVLVDDRVCGKDHRCSDHPKGERRPFELLHKQKTFQKSKSCHLFVNLGIKK